MIPPVAPPAAGYRGPKLGSSGRERLVVSMKSVWLRIYGGLSSLKLTIVVLTVLAAVLIYGTFYESANGTPMAQKSV